MQRTSSLATLTSSCSILSRASRFFLRARSWSNRRRKWRARGVGVPARPEENSDWGLLVSGFRSPLGPRLRFRFGLAGRRLFCVCAGGLALPAGLSLSGEQHARAAIELHVSARGGNQRALRAVRSCRVQVQAVQPEDALAIGGQLARGIQ